MRVAPIRFFEFFVCSGAFGGTSRRSQILAHDGPNALQRFAPRGHRRGRRTAPISGPSDPAPRSYPFGRPSSLHTRPTPRAHGPTADPDPCSTLQPRRRDRGDDGAASTARDPDGVSRPSGASQNNRTCSEPSTAGKRFSPPLARLLRSASACNDAPATACTASPRHIALSVPTPHNRFFPLHASPLTFLCTFSPSSCTFSPSPLLRQTIGFQHPPAPCRSALPLGFSERVPAPAGAMPRRFTQRVLPLSHFHGSSIPAGITPRRFTHLAHSH